MEKQITVTVRKKRTDDRGEALKSRLSGEMHDGNGFQGKGNERVIQGMR